MHFTGILDGLQDLAPKVRGAAVPEIGVFPGEIKQGHCIPGSALALGSETDGARVSKGEGGMMAGSAGLGLIDGEPRIVEKAFSKADASLRGEVVCWPRGLGNVGGNLDRQVAGGGQHPAELRLGSRGMVGLEAPEGEAAEELFREFGGQWVPSAGVGAWGVRDSECAFKNPGDFEVKCEEKVLVEV